jgi:hypothetical protein
MKRYGRRGMVIWVALAVLMVVAIGGLMMVLKNRSGLRQLELAREEANLRWAADSVLANLQNRLKKAPWSNRFYKTGPSPYTTTLSYRGVSCWAQLQDSVVASVVQTGVTDIFVRVEEQDTVFGVYQRVQLVKPFAPNDPVVNVTRQRTVREDFQVAALREETLRVMDDGDPTGSDRLLAGDLAARAAAAAAPTVSADQMWQTVSAAAADVATERRFRTAIRQANLMSDRGDPAAAMAPVTEATSIAASSSAADKPQRELAARTAMARIQWALGIVGPVAERAGHLTQASTLLDAATRDPVPACEDERRRRAVDRASVAVVARRPRTKPEREQARTAAGRDLGNTLRNLGVMVESRPERPTGDRWVDTFNNQWGPTLVFNHKPGAAGDTKKMFILSGNNTTVTPLLLRDGLEPVVWMQDGSSLLTVDPSDRRRVAIVDRRGQILRRLPARPHASFDTTSVALVGDTGKFVYFGFGPSDDEEGHAFWVQDMAGGNPRKIKDVPQVEQGLVVSYPEPIRFSSDASSVAWMDPTSGVRLQDAASFLAGNTTGGQVIFPVGSNRTQGALMSWARDTSTPDTLFCCANARDNASVNRNKLLMFNGQNPTAAPVVSQEYPSGFNPGVIIPWGDEKKVTVLDMSGQRAVTIDYTTSAFTGSFATQELGGFYNVRVGTTSGHEVYLYSVEQQGRTQDIFKWDMASGQPRSLGLAPANVGAVILNLEHPVALE